MFMVKNRFLLNLLSLAALWVALNRFVAGPTYSYERGVVIAAHHRLKIVAVMDFGCGTTASKTQLPVPLEYAAADLPPE
jgi:hypothetical protein